MDMHAHRRNRLQQLIDRDYGGDRMAMGRALGFTNVRMGQLLSNTFRDGQNFGEKIARKIEGALHLPLLYLDQINSSEEAGAVTQPMLPPASHNPAVAEAPVQDGAELAILQSYRNAGPVAKAAIRKIMRVMLVADEASISEQAHTFCRAVNEQMQMTLTMTPQIIDAAFDEAELMLLGNFRASNPSVRRMVLAGANCAEPQDDDAHIDRDTGCTLQELRLIQAYRAGSTPFKNTLLRLLTIELPTSAAQHKRAL